MTFPSHLLQVLLFLSAASLSSVVHAFFIVVLFAVGFVLKGWCLRPSKAGDRSDSLIFVNSRLTEASIVSCNSGNSFFWILFCLLPMFLGAPIEYSDFLLDKAVDRSPAAVCILGFFGEHGDFSVRPFTKNGTHKLFQSQLLFPSSPQTIVPSDHVDIV
ncbi:hypothetical protein RJ641_028656 [Dillenia turbinata]|uniref:Uncharacterized protein n=1 Tax=Dillenia turbinata TaxID=194707 RepID=A0AAN8W4V0_9MAGN